MGSHPIHEDHAACIGLNSSVLHCKGRNCTLRAFDPTCTARDTLGDSLAQTLHFHAGRKQENGGDSRGMLRQ